MNTITSNPAYDLVGFCPDIERGGVERHRSRAVGRDDGGGRTENGSLLRL
jgi:fructose-1-phosphate kinase PfkB-like protein